MYSRRCLKDFFGYCAEEKKGQLMTVYSTAEEQSVAVGNCEKEWRSCESYVSNTKANPPKVTEKKKGETG